MEMQSDLARVRGLGSAREGAHHWWVQRLTAIALVPLGLWFAFSITQLVGADLAQFRAWLATPWVTLLVVLFVGAMFHHLQRGLQVVIEDYVHGDKARTVSIVIVKLAAWFLAVSSLLAVFQVAFGGQG